MSETTIFFSYSRDDSDFVLKLAQELREAGADVWLDQLDIKPGSRWDRSIENALDESKTVLVVLSKTSVASNNVMDEVSYAIDEGKKIVPILFEDCDVHFRIRRFHFADFTNSYQKGISSLIDALGLDEKNEISAKNESITSNSLLEKELENNEVEKVEAGQGGVELANLIENEPSTKVDENTSSELKGKQDQNSDGAIATKKMTWVKRYILTSILLFNIFSFLFFVYAGLTGLHSGSKVSYFFEVGLFALISSLLVIGLGFLIEKMFFRKAKNSIKKYAVTLLISYNLLFVIWNMYLRFDISINSKRYHYIHNAFNTELRALLLLALIIGALVILIRRFRNRARL